MTAASSSKISDGAAVNTPSFTECRAQSGNPGDVDLVRLFVLVDHHVALAALTVTGTISASNAPNEIALPSRDGRSRRERVDAGAIIGILGARHVAEHAHRLCLAVVRHVVEELEQFDPRARAVEQVGRIGHRLHAARDDDSGRARLDQVVARRHHLDFHTLLIVVQGADVGMSAPIAAWRAAPGPGPRAARGQ